MAFEFDGDGFLSERSSELEGDIHAAYCDLFEGTGRINHDCHQLLFSADIRNRDLQATIVATLFMRVLDHYQATIVLLGRGMIAPARVTLRALVESAIKLRGIVINADALQAFIDEDLVHRLKLINKARNNAHPNLEATRAAITGDSVEELKREITQRGAKEITTEQWSRLADMHDWYITNYSLLSKAVHTQVRELEDYLKIGNSGEIQQLVYAPSIHELPILILTAAHCVLIAASAFDKVFDMDFGPKGTEHTTFVDASFEAIDSAD